MAPGVGCTQALSQSHLPNASTNSQNIFEGPEKKLQVSFYIRSHNSQYQFMDKCTDLRIGDDSDNKQHQSINRLNRRGLRALQNHHIEEILQAASCSVLSTTSNHKIDAYLLSESSLFISDSVLTLKTCGTTTLLYALPVILQIARDILNMTVKQVQFSRVAYLFPKAQIYPHGTFSDESFYLEKVLRQFCHSFSNFSHSTPNWHLYVAHCSNVKYRTSPFEILYTSDPPCDLNDKSWANSHNKFAFEVNMFDLDRNVMNKFIFHDRTKIIGKDDPQVGTTYNAGILDFVDEYDVIDGFNFDPCGYSMNALHQDTYITMHITPEVEGSYVSYEITGSSKSFASLLTRLVKYFKPNQFTVSLLNFGLTYTGAAPLTPSMVTKFFGCTYQSSCKPKYFQERSGWKGAVLSFQKNYDICTLITPIQKRISTSDELSQRPCLQHVASTYFATKVAIEDMQNVPKIAQTLITDLEDGDPCFMVNLTQIANNLREIARVASQKSIRPRYVVSCNPDRAILNLLGKHHVEFEACSYTEVELLLKCKIRREQIVMVTPVLTEKILKAFPKVGTVALFERPSHIVEMALKASGVNVELRLRGNSSQSIDFHLNEFSDVMGYVTRIAFDQMFSQGSLKKSVYCDDITHFQRIANKVNENRDNMIWDDNPLVHLGECWQRNSKSNVGEMQQLICYLSMIEEMKFGMSIDISRGVLHDSVHLGVRVIGRRERLRNRNESITYHYYLNDGLYGSFSNLLTEERSDEYMNWLKPIVLQKMKTEKIGSEYYPSTLFGPTCDGLDRIWSGKLKLLNVGDWLIFENMGSYCISSSCGFNGFGNRFDVKYFVM